MLWQQLLQLPEDSALKFARFVVEEAADETATDAANQSVAFEPNRQMLMELVTARLMTYFKRPPALYTDEKEAAVVGRFKRNFDGDKIKQFGEAFAKMDGTPIDKAFFVE